MSRNTDLFDQLCGNCAGIDLGEITPDDVRTMGSYYGATPDEIDMAIAGLAEYRAICWNVVESVGMIPSGTAADLRWRINGYLTNGLTGERFTLSDAIAALAEPGRYKVEWM